MQATVHVLSFTLAVTPTHFQFYDLDYIRIRKINIVIHPYMLGHVPHQVFAGDPQNIEDTASNLLPFQFVFVLGQMLKFLIHAGTFDHVVEVSRSI